MCGIFGYIGHKAALPVIMDGLHRLEYRGYDSAGVAIFDASGNFQIRRSVGKLSSLSEILEKERATGTIPEGWLGIGHTRWATHGKPTVANAHPHLGPRNQVVVVHNGIIENYLELKNSLVKAGYGYNFASETDTEVLAHLLEKYFVCDGMTLKEAMLQVMGQIKGTAAIVAISSREPDKLVCGRISNAGAVVIGYGDGQEMFVASDIAAILPHTSRMSFLDSGEVAVLTASGAQFYSPAGQEIPDKEITTIKLDAISCAKGGFRHFMLKEIHEQPQALEDTLRGRLNLREGRVRMEDLNFNQADLEAIQRVSIVACGTSWHAGLIGKFLIEELAQLPVEVDYASEFRYRNPLIGPGHLLVAVTQSGETVDTLAAIEEAHHKGAKIISIVNVIGSQAARAADGVIYMQAGPEIGVASTKAFTTSLADLVMLGVYLGQMRGVLSTERALRLVGSLYQLPRLMEIILFDLSVYDRLARRKATTTDFLFLGRGINYPVALEGALKLKELSYIHAEGYPAGEMKHGPIALITNGLPVVVVAPRNSVYSKVLSAIEQVKARDGWVLAVGTEGDTQLKELADEVILVPETDELLTPVLTVLPLQLLSYSLAVQRGCDVDQPRNLAKSVTVE